MGALCAVRPTIFFLPSRAPISGAASRGDLGRDTPILIPSMNRADRLRCTPCPHK